MWTTLSRFIIWKCGGNLIEVFARFAFAVAAVLAEPDTTEAEAESF
jgi:hypothetical protein